MVFSDNIFVRWKFAVSAFPTIKYLYAYSHHCANINNHPPVNLYQHQFLTLYKKDAKKSVQLLPLSHSKTKKPSLIMKAGVVTGNHNSHYFPNLSEVTRHKASSSVCFADQLLHSFEVQSTNHSEYLTNNLSINNFVETSLNQNRIYKFDSSGKENQLSSPKYYSSNTLNQDKQPADDPKQKIRMLTEKIRMEAPMLLTKTSPYHDFSIYTDGVELYYENARLKRLILRGRRKYKVALSLFRRYHNFRMVNSELEVIGIRTVEEQNTVEVRWRVCGWSRLNVLYTFLFHVPSNPSYTDFVSTLHVNDAGLIWRHEVSKMKHLTNAMPLREKIRFAGQNAMGAVASMKNQFINENNHRLS